VQACAECGMTVIHLMYSTGQDTLPHVYRGPIQSKGPHKLKLCNLTV
jgi:hypothetical protein